MFMPGVTLNSYDAILEDIPSSPRYQLSALQEYLTTKNDKVCVLYGLRRTGKTTLMKQAIKWLVEEKGISFNNIFYATVKDPGQAILEDIADSISEGSYKYIFLDEVSFCSDFLSNCSQLYDYFTTMRGNKVVIAGTNLVSIFVATKSRLYDRTYRIPVHYLTFYEYCRFNGITNPGLSEFNKYLKYGGIFEENPNAFEYVQTSVIEHLISTIYNSDLQTIHCWYSKSAFEDLEGLANNILLYAVGSHISPHTVLAAYSFKREPKGLKLDSAVRFAMQKKLNLLRYTKLDISKNELNAFMDFMEDCGLLLTLTDISANAAKGNPAKTYVTFPFIRFSYTMELASRGGVLDPELKNEYLGALMKVCAISEYHLAFPQDLIYFWREEVDGVPAECDLIITNYKDSWRGPHRAAYEIKASKQSSRGQRGFEKFARLHPEYEIFPEDCKVIGGEDVVDWVYELGKLAYISAGLEKSTTGGITIPEKRTDPQRTSAFGDLNGWNMRH